MKNQKNKIRIGIDIDGTIRDIYTPLLKKLRERNPDMVFPPVSQWEHYEVWKNLSMSEEVLKKIWFEECAEYIYLTGARSYEPLIQQNWYQMVLISGQPNTNTEQLTLEYLKTRGILYDEIHFTTQKHTVVCDYYIEDSPAYLKQLWNGFPWHPYGRPWIYRINRPWNNDSNTGMFCHLSFDTVKEAIDCIKKRKTNGI